MKGFSVCREESAFRCKRRRRRRRRGSFDLGLSERVLLRDELKVFIWVQEEPELSGTFRRNTLHVFIFILQLNNLLKGSNHEEIKLLNEGESYFRAPSSGF